MHGSITTNSTAEIIQFPAVPNWTPDDAAESRRRNSRRVFDLNHQVRQDRQLGLAAKVVSACIAEKHLDHRTGIAMVGTVEIAEQCGCSPTTVKRAVKELADRGHWDVEWGSQGSGHANHYRIGKRPPADLSGAIKGPRADMNH